MISLTFDLDGTLLDTLEDIASSCNVVLQKYGFPTHDLVTYKRIVGNGFKVLIKKILPENVSISEKEFQERYTDKTKPFPQMTETLEKLAMSGIKLAVLSNKKDHLSKNLIHQFFPQIPFLHIQGAIEGIPLKPNPESLLAMIDKYGLTNATNYYVGDTDIDIKTAHNANMIGIGVTWGYRDRDCLKSAGADIIIDKPEDLLFVLKD